MRSVTVRYKEREISVEIGHSDSAGALLQRIGQAFNVSPGCLKSSRLGLFDIDDSLVAYVSDENVNFENRCYMAIVPTPDLAAAKIVSCLHALISSLSDTTVDNVDPSDLLHLEELSKFVSCEEFLVEFLAADGATALIKLVSTFSKPSKRCEEIIWHHILLILAKLAPSEVKEHSTDSSSPPSFCWSEVPDKFILSVMNCPFMNCDWQLMRLGLTVLRCILAHRPEKITVIVNNHGGEFVYRLLKRLCLKLFDIPRATSATSPGTGASAALRSFVVRSKSVTSVRDSSSTVNCILADRGERLDLENLLLTLLRQMAECIECTDPKGLNDLIRADVICSIVEDLVCQSQSPDAPSDGLTWNSSTALGLKRSSVLQSPATSPLFRTHSTCEREILGELLTLQDFILLPLKDLLSRPFNSDDSISLVFLEDLHELVYGNAVMFVSDTQKTDIYERFGFTDPSTPLADFQEPLGSLYFRCLSTLVDHAPEFVVSLLGDVPTANRSHFQCLIPNDSLRVPIVNATKRVTHIICHLFGLLPKDPNSLRPQYLPLPLPQQQQQQQTDFELFGRWLYFPFFSSVDRIESSFMDLFMVVFRTFCDTWSVLNATPGDMCRVSQITMERLTTALSCFPTQLDALAAVLEVCDVGSVRRLWSDWTANAESSLISSHPAITQLRAQLVDYYRATVSKQRLHSMVSGPPLHYVETKGVLKDRGVLKVSLSPDHKCFLLRDGFGKDVGNWPLSLLTSVRGGVDEKKTKALKRNIVLSLRQPDLLEKEDLPASKTSTLKPTRVTLTAPTELLYTCWLDGLDVLQNYLPRSERFSEDVSQLVELDLQMRLLGLDLTLIPERPVSPPSYYPDTSSLPA